MIESKKIRTGCCLIVLCLALSVGLTDIVNAQSSQNYKINQAIISQGGTAAQSNDYKKFEIVGQLSPVGVASSNQYKVTAGVFPGGATTKSLSLSFSQGWNMFSINLNPLDPRLEILMLPIISHLKIMKNGAGQMYIPAYGINEIGSINYLEGYQVYLNQACQLPLRGRFINPHTPIALPGGWSLISFLPSVPMNAAVALANIRTQLVLVKNNAGQHYIPDYGINDIGDMQPGEGYQVYLKARATLIYPAVGTQSETGEPALATTAKARSMPEYFRFTTRTGNQAVIVIPERINCEEMQLARGDEIAVFNPSGQCCGAIVWEETSAALTVWGDNAQTDTLDGFQVGEPFQFRVRQKAAQKVFPVEAHFSTGPAPKYQSNRLMVLTTLKMLPETDQTANTSTALPTSFKLLQNYPNPFNPETAIEYQLPREALVNFKIYDLNGQEVCCLDNGIKSPGCYMIRWNGRDQEGLVVGSGMYFYFIEMKTTTPPLQSFRAVRKMIFLK